MKKIAEAEVQLGADLAAVHGTHAVRATKAALALDTTLALERDLKRKHDAENAALWDKVEHPPPPRLFAGFGRSRRILVRTPSRS